MKGPYWIIKINQTGRNHGKGGNWKIMGSTGVFYKLNFIFGDSQGFGENIDGIKPDPGNMLESGFGVYSCLLKGTVNDSKLHNLGRLLREAFGTAVITVQVGELGFSPGSLILSHLEYF
jgi:hypothetical protein